MAHSHEARLARVHAVIEAARQVSARRQELIAPLVASTGLSEQGVCLAFDRCLETSPSESDLRVLLARERPVAESSVILPSNVFVASLRALVVATARSPRVWVKLSRREPVFARALLSALPEGLCEAISDGGHGRVAVAGSHGGPHRVDVYGGADAVAAYAASVGPDSTRAFGPGYGLCVVLAQDDIEACARAIVEDVVLFDQRGCLSPRCVLSEGSAQRSAKLARALADALVERARTVPVGTLADAEQSARTHFAQSMRWLGDVLDSSSGVVAWSDSYVLAPAGRCLAVVTCPDPQVILDTLRAHAHDVVTVGARAGLSFLRELRLPQRVMSLGCMQTPPLDGPVDLRTFAVA